jgi:multimeric flavodoxin WrbA
MHVMAMNASPLKKRGNTNLILAPFLKGMEEEGAEVELYHTSDLALSPCRGDFACWTTTPGRCAIEDDMRWLLPKLDAADAWVFASPVYVDGIASTLKTLVDRTIPIVLPSMVLGDGRLRHPRRTTSERPRTLAVVSNCGFWERETFEPLEAHMRAIAANGAAVYAGALVRPHGPALGPMLEQGAPRVTCSTRRGRRAGSSFVTEQWPKRRWPRSPATSCRGTRTQGC